MTHGRHERSRFLHCQCPLSMSTVNGVSPQKETSSSSTGSFPTSAPLLSNQPKVLFTFQPLCPLTVPGVCQLVVDHEATRGTHFCSMLIVWCVVEVKSIEFHRHVYSDYCPTLCLCPIDVWTENIFNQFVQRNMNRSYSNILCESGIRLLVVILNVRESLLFLKHASPGPLPRHVLHADVFKGCTAWFRMVRREGTKQREHVVSD